SFGILERATPYGTLRFGNELRPSGFWNGLRPMEHFVSGTDFFLREFGTGYALWNTSFRDNWIGLRPDRKKKLLFGHSIER
ncbi:hypothetical protein JYA59_08505, partial [Vibrio neptunius]|uniref:hypothetical protein n=1 Tax=Vibrio neptunius TaxID=170651 RepID=UPI0019D2293F